MILSLLLVIIFFWFVLLFFSQWVEDFCQSFVSSFSVWLSWWALWLTVWSCNFCYFYLLKVVLLSCNPAEPFYGSISLYNQERKEKLSEDFYFHISPTEMQDVSHWAHWTVPFFVFSFLWLCKVGLSFFLNQFFPERAPRCTFSCRPNLHLKIVECFI